MNRINVNKTEALRYLKYLSNPDACIECSILNKAGKGKKELGCTLLGCVTPMRRCTVENSIINKHFPIGACSDLVKVLIKYNKQIKMNIKSTPASMFKTFEGQDAIFNGIGTIIAQETAKEEENNK